MNFQNRITKVKQFLDDKGIDCIVIVESSNIFYLTGLYGIEGSLCITNKGDIVFFTSGIFYQYVCDKLQSINIPDFSPEIFDRGLFAKFLKQFKNPALFSSEFSVHNWKFLCSETGKQIRTIDNFVADMRAIKEDEEIEKIQKAEKITFSVLKKIKNIIKAGISEIDISAEIYYQLRKSGADRESFPPIVASGINSSYPHHIPTRRKIKHNDILIIDIGAAIDGYSGDITETIILGEPSLHIKKSYDAILQVHRDVEELISRGEKLCRKLHIQAVDTLKKYGIDKFFTHTLGHGVGIDVHELPILSAKSKDILKKGMVFTVEPGVYIPGEFGIRIERMFYA